MKKSLYHFLFVGLFLSLNVAQAQTLAIQNKNGINKVLLTTGNKVKLHYNNGLRREGKLMFYNDSVYVLSKYLSYFDKEIIKAIKEKGISIDNEFYPKEDLRIINDTLLLPIRELADASDLLAVYSKKKTGGWIAGGTLLIVAAPVATLFTTLILSYGFPNAGFEFLAYLVIPEIIAGIVMLRGKKYKSSKWHFEIQH